MPVAKKPTSHNLIADEVYVNTTSSSVSNGVLVFVLLLVLALNCLVLYFVMGYTLSLTDKQDGDVGIKRVLLELEYEKVGGKKNYETLQKYSLMQIKDQMGKIEQYVNGDSPSNTTNQPQADSGNKVLSQANISELLTDAVVEGSKESNIVWIEFSDMECYYCQVQYHQNKPVDILNSKYGTGTISHVLKNAYGVKHQNTEAKALANLCAEKLGGDKAYTYFYNEVYKLSSPESSVAMSELPNIAKRAGLDVKKWQQCLDNKETQVQFDKEFKEMTKYGMNGTPGNMILNKKTGKYVTLPGAVPGNYFIEAIDNLMK